MVHHKFESCYHNFTHYLTINKNHRDLKSSGRTATFYSGIPVFESPVISREVTLNHEIFVLLYIPNNSSFAKLPSTRKIWGHVISEKASCRTPNHSEHEWCRRTAHVNLCPVAGQLM